MAEYGHPGRVLVGTGIALQDHPPRYPPVSPPRVHPSPPTRCYRGVLRVQRVQSGRGAQIGSSTHLRALFLAVKDYYRGL